MGKIAWYKRDPVAALDGMRVLSLEERGAYNTVLDLIYSRDGNLPDDDRFICGWLGVDLRIWKRIKARLIALGKLYVRGGLLGNARADAVVHDVLAKVVATAQAGRSKGRKSGAVPLKDNALDGTDDRQTKIKNKKEESPTPETPTPPTSEPELPLEPSAPAIPASKPKAQKPPYPPEFEQLWQAYPLRREDKAAKVDVFNRWKTEAKGQDHEAIIAAARAFARANGQDDYRIGLKSWLRNRAWLSGPVLVTNGQPVRASPLTGAEFNRAERAHREKVEDQVEAKGHARWSPEWEQEVAVLMMEWVNEQRRSA